MLIFTSWPTMIRPSASMSKVIPKSLRSIAPSALFDSGGVVQTDAELFGGFAMSPTSGPQQRPRERLIEELEKQYEVVRVDPNSPITETFDVMLAVQPSSLTPPQLNNFIEAVRKGQPTAIFEDPLPGYINGAPGTSSRFIFAATGCPAGVPTCGSGLSPFSDLKTPNQEKLRPDRSGGSTGVGGSAGGGEGGATASGGSSNSDNPCDGVPCGTSCGTTASGNLHCDVAGKCSDEPPSLCDAGTPNMPPSADASDIGMCASTTHGQACAEYDRAPFVAEPARISHPIAKGRAQSLGQQDRPPIEHLDLGRRDGIN